MSDLTSLALPHIAKLHAYTPGLQPTERGWTKLNTNECPYAPSPRVAEALRREDELKQVRRHLERERGQQLEEFRLLGRPGTVNVDGATSRRVYAGQLVTLLLDIERERTFASQKAELCRQELIKADQQVQALEKLRDKQLAEFRINEERKEARNLEEAWQAAHAGDFRR